MDDFDLRDLLAPPMRIRSDMVTPPAPHKPMPPSMMLGMSYTPVQCWQDLYEPEEGLENGTIFRQLRFPFEGGARH